MFQSINQSEKQEFLEEAQEKNSVYPINVLLVKMFEGNFGSVIDQTKMIKVHART